MTAETISRSSGRLSSWLWGVAYAGLALGSISVPVNASGVRSVAIGGGLVWCLACALDRFRGAGRRRAGAKPLVLVLLIAAAALEALGASWALSEHSGAQGTWFALAMSFALAGIATVWCREPSDGALVCQLFFHALMIFPLLAQLAGIWLNRPGQVGSLAPLRRLLVVVDGVALPLLFLTLLAALAHDLSRPDEERDRPALTLLAAQAAYIVILFRWAQDGIG